MEYDDKLATPTNWLSEENELTLRATQLTWESDRVLAVTLRALDGGALPAWTPGSHIDLQLPGGILRQYSLCGDPGDPSCYRIGVLREEQSRGGSEYVHEDLRPGTRVRVVGPRNRFAFDPAGGHVFIAGGIGITPLLPMIRAADAAGRPWRLLYAGRERRTLGFLSDLSGYGDRVEVFASDEGRFIDLAAVVAALDPGEHIHACGPEPLLAALEAECAPFPERLHIERFKPKTTETPVEAEAELRVECRASGITLTVPPDRSILDSLEEAGIAVGSSCREGICGTCELRVLAGTPDHRDSILSPAEQAAGKTMMVCVSRAVTPELVLDI